MDLAVTDLSCARGGLPVLAGLSFRLVAGQALVLRGPNGAGKTTLLRTLAGLQPALSGAVSLPADAMAYAGHADGIKAVLSVTENLRFWADVHGADGVEDAMARFDLTRLRNRPAGSLSAGQKRRLSLARLVLTGRPVWLLDEPTVSLDTASVSLFGDAVRAHLSGGGLAVIATHIDLGVAGAGVLDLSAFRAEQMPMAEVGW
ncbi:MAG: heme ABC exporter ATP-binding protein CcmA [Paracoccaceae bacterium]